MCYGMGCPYERWDGECDKKGRIPCPMDDPEGHEEWLDAEDYYYAEKCEELRDRNAFESEED